MSPDLKTAIERMNREERLQLLDDVWALVRDDSLAVPMSHAEELRARLAKPRLMGCPETSRRTYASESAVSGELSVALSSLQRYYRLEWETSLSRGVKV